MELTIKGLYKTFEGMAGEPSFILDIPELQLELGALTFILGHNGSGKSVFLKLLCGQLSSSKKPVSIQHDNEIWQAHKYRTSIVRQRAEENLSTDLTVKENLLLRIKSKGIMDRLFPLVRLAPSAKQIVKRHSTLLQKLNQPCRDLSGGQKQALAYLSVTIQRSEILCLDEFLAATDHRTTHMLRKLAREYADNIPACVIVVSHDIELALSDADRILILKDGKLVKDLNHSSQEWDKDAIIKHMM